jgi:histidyl-tRNA synthetase
MGGGRYDGLVKELGGPELPAVGFACGMERLILAMQAETSARRVDVFVIAAQPESKTQAEEYLYRLRAAGITAEMDFQDRSMKALMKTAARLNARYALIAGAEGTLTVRDMEKSEQNSTTIDMFIGMITP